MDIKDVMTFKEAARLWGKSPSTFRRTIVLNKALMKGVDFRKSDSTWLVTRAAMEKVYGEIKECNEVER